MVSAQALHGAVLKDPPRCLGDFCSLREASVFMAHPAQNAAFHQHEKDAAVLAALPNSLLSLDLKTNGYYFEVSNRLQTTCRTRRGSSCSKKPCPQS